MFAVSCPTLVPGIRRFSQSLAAVTFPSIFFDTVHPGADFLSLACQRHLVVDMWTLEKHVRSWHVEVRRVSSIAMIWMTSRGSSATWGRTADTLSHEIPVVVWKLGQLLRWALNINPVHVPPGHRDIPSLGQSSNPNTQMVRRRNGHSGSAASDGTPARSVMRVWGGCNSFRLVCGHMPWKDANALSPHFVFVLFEPFFLSKWVLRPAQAWQQFPPGPHKHGMQLPDVHKKTREAIRPVEKFQHTIIIHSCSSTIIHPLEVLEVLMMWDSVHDVPLVFVLQLYVSAQAQQNNVNTILLTWPDFTKPDETFIENYTSLVPDSWRTLKVQIYSQAASWFVKACQDTIAFGAFFFLQLQQARIAR